jgi:hypothetical protein
LNRWRRALLAAQNSLRALFHQLLAHPVNHERAGIQGTDDAAVAPAPPPSQTSAFSNIRAFSSPSRRALSLPSSVSSCSRSALLSLATYFFTEISVQTIMRPIAYSRGDSESQNLNPCKLIEPSNYDAPIADRGVSAKGLHLHTAFAQRTTTRIAERSLEF